MSNGVPGPSWVDPVSKFITQVGFPVACAGFLLYWVFTFMTANVEKVSNLMLRNGEVVRELIHAQREATAENKTAVEAELAELRVQTQAMQQQTQLIAELLRQAKAGPTQQAPPAS
jgi:hypothetical protein